MITYHFLNLLSINLPKFFFIHVLYTIKKYVNLRIDLILVCLWFNQTCMGMFPYPMHRHVKIVNFSGEELRFQFWSEVLN